MQLKQNYFPKQKQNVPNIKEPPCSCERSTHRKTLSAKAVSGDRLSGEGSHVHSHLATQTYSLARSPSLSGQCTRVELGVRKIGTSRMNQ